ncbi:hypothetical protein VTG60DRAFT_503 [Thermothelomyces hinnuleus]
MPHILPPTCLRIGGNHRSSDAVIHYNGCLPETERQQFRDSLDPENQQRIGRADAKIADLRSRLETVDHASTAGSRLRDFKRAMAEWRAATGRSHVPAALSPGYSQSQTSRNAALGASRGVDGYIKASVMYFKDGQPYDLPGLPKSFPKQKVPVADLLSEDAAKNPIMQPVEDGILRYFHLAANNLTWIEEAQVQTAESKTETVLQPGYWKGQQNFDADCEVHARHMRPFFSGISVDPLDSEHQSPKSMVLFMPYLHWETDRGRARSAKIIKEARKYNLSSIRHVGDRAKNRLARTETHVTVAPSWESQPQPSTPGQHIDRRRALGHALRCASALLEAMDSHVEEQLTMRYLHAEPPLHPRRTLDQAYYGALRSTGARDRDQVVYRGTTAQPHQCVGAEACPQCKEDSRKTPRILMVDQLWLWCLDEKTIITSFPRRWARNRPDSSAIHKSLRTRLRHARRGEISSAYDLVLMIIDETSRVFFDRTKTDTDQPNLVELFNAAIRDLTYKQTAAFNQFLIYTHLASQDYRRQRYLSSDGSTQNNLLNINPEGELLKEVKDIQDELHIMIRIKKQQQAVVESFAKHIRRALTPLLERSSLHHSQDPDPGGICEEKQRQSAQRTLNKADVLLEDIDERIGELRALQQNAQNTSSALKDLLTLKQQQAGVIEAREAVKQAQLTLKQGQSIMIFTVVTIVFLPLSFCASLRAMLPVSAGVILVSFALAFSRGVLANGAVVLARSAASFAWNMAATWIPVKTGLYLLGREMVIQANRLRDREGTVTGGMKAEVLRREKNLERTRAAAHVRALARQRQTQPAAAAASRGGGMGSDGQAVGTAAVSPCSEHLPSSPSPFMRISSVRSEGMEDVELGERMSRKHN